MPNDAFYAVVVAIGGGGRLGQHILGVEDVEAFVFHRAHVEVAGCHNHEALQIEREAKPRLVPRYAGLQRLHGVARFVQIARAHIDLQQMFFARAAGDALLTRYQQPRHQRKQVAGFAERVAPLRVVAAIGQIALLQQIAV